MCIRISAKAPFKRFQPFFPTLASNVLSATRNAPPGQVPPNHRPVTFTLTRPRISPQWGRKARIHGLVYRGSSVDPPRS